jgi:D-glycero-D-manno-heptose 1,7-bisphosphate phosphatase
MNSPGPLLILDRDGVINEDSPDFIKSPDEWIPIPGSIEAIARLNRAGFVVTVASNQSGLARGLFTAGTLASIHQKMLQQVADAGGEIAGIFICPHGPDDGCECRKPRPGLYRQVARAFARDLAGVPIIGDSLRDLEAAIAVGARPILVLTGKGKATLAAGGLPDGAEVFPDLAAAAAALIEGRR